MHPGKKYRKRHNPTPKARFIARENIPGKQGRVVAMSKPDDTVGSGRKAIPLSIEYGRIAGHAEGYKVTAKSDLYIRLEPCECSRCSEIRAEGRLKEDLGLSSDGIIELISDPKLEFIPDFEPTGTANVPRAKGLIAILRALQADKKGPWTTKPFWFNGRLVKPGKNGWHIEQFDRLSRLQQDASRPINVKARKNPQTTPHDNKIGFEDRAQMNREFEKRFSS